MTRLYLALALVAVILAGAFGIWQDGKRAERARAAAEADAQFKATTEAINNADVGSGDPDDDLDWLRKRGQR